MCILYFAQQYCSLGRAKMPDMLQQKMKSVNSMNKLRNLTKLSVKLQESFMESINPITEIVNSKSESMSFFFLSIFSHKLFTHFFVKRFCSWQYLILYCFGRASFFFHNVSYHRKLHQRKIRTQTLKRLCFFYFGTWFLCVDVASLESKLAYLDSDL